jgi:hypothetical protein
LNNAFGIDGDDNTYKATYKAQLYITYKAQLYIGFVRRDHRADRRYRRYCRATLPAGFDAR